MTSYCPECGETTTEADAFCSECGTPLDTEQSAADGHGRQSGGWGSQQQSGNDRQSGGQGEPETAGRGYNRRTRRGQPPQGGADTGRGDTIVRKGAVETFSEALGWMTGLPALVGAFAVYVALLATPTPESPVLDIAFTLFQTGVGAVVGGIAHVYAERYVTGEQVRGGVGELFSTAGDVASKLLSLLGASILYGLAFAFGTLLLVFPGLYLLVRLALALPACVLDDQRAIESLKTSWSVADGNLLKIGVIYLLGLLGLLVGAIVGFSIATPLITEVGETSGVVLAGLVVAPILGTVFGASQMALARVYLENRQPERQQTGGYQQGPARY